MCKSIINDVLSSKYIRETINLVSLQIYVPNFLTSLSTEMNFSFKSITLSSKGEVLKYTNIVGNFLQERV